MKLSQGVQFHISVQFQLISGFRSTTRLTILPTVTHEIDANKKVLSTFLTPPIKAACTSCHDGFSELLGVPVSTHADIFTVNADTANAVEQCAECHGEGALLAVSRVHARN